MESRERGPFRRRLFAHAPTRGVVPPACPKCVPTLSRPRLTCWRRRNMCALACSAEQKRASWLIQSGARFSLFLFFLKAQERGFAPSAKTQTRATGDTGDTRRGPRAYESPGTRCRLAATAGQNLSYLQSTKGHENIGPRKK